MIDILAQSPLLLLFVVTGIGYRLGRVRIAGSRLGVAAVLFAGLGIGALDARLALPDIIFQLGLLLFVYTMGLSSGPGFFASLTGQGLRDNLFVILMVTLGAAMSLGAGYLLRLSPPHTAGLFTGSLTNTPALAAAMGYVALLGGGATLSPTDVVVGYSIAYPVSVLSFLLTIQFFQRRWRIDYAADARYGAGGLPEPIADLTVRVTRPDVAGRTVAELAAERGWRVIFTQLVRGTESEVVGAATRLQVGDLVALVGPPDRLSAVLADLGELHLDDADLYRSEIGVRKIYVSNPEVAGLRVRELNLQRRFGAMITVVRRGDLDLLPHAEMVLELGDRVRVLARRNALPPVARLLGDSVRALSEIDIASFSFGLVLGIGLGLIPIPLPGGITVRLGLAGGPLIVALVLGARARTGPFVWGLPYGANLMLRQLGLILFLAGVGVKAGYAFVQTLVAGGGLLMLIAGGVIATVVAVLSTWIGYRLLKIPFGVLTGMLAAIQTQPATLAYALEQSGNDLPNLGYATTYPAAMVLKIIYVQLLLGFLL